jgi:hypothetical protein
MTDQASQDRLDAIARTRAPGDPVVSSGKNWVTFALVMLVIAGVVNCIGGIAAIGDSRFFAGSAKYIVGDLESLGWVVLGIGVVQLLAAVGIWAHSWPAVWLGVVAAGVNAIAQLLLLPAQPLWSLGIFAIDVVVLYALITYAEPESE